MFMRSPGIDAGIAVVGTGMVESKAVAQSTRVSVILVTFNSAGVVADALQSLPEGAEAIVVDNDSHDATVEQVERLGAHIIRSSTNVGFGNACNLGANQTSREFLFFLNPDARLQEGTIDYLVRAADNDAGCAAFNPRLLGTNGRQFFRTRSHLFPAQEKAKGWVPSGDTDIHVASGAALLCRRTIFEEIGGFDPRIFMYCEDDDLALRLQNAGWRLRYVHNAVVMHHGNQSTAPSAEVDRMKAYHLMRSRWYTARKHGIRFSRGGKALQCALRLAVATLTMNRPGCREYAARMRALMERPPEID